VSATVRASFFFFFFFIAAAVARHITFPPTSHIRLAASTPTSSTRYDSPSSLVHSHDPNGIFRQTDCTAAATDARRTRWLYRAHTREECAAHGCGCLEVPY
jgi:hypothetical protein